MHCGHVQRERSTGCTLSLSHVEILSGLLMISKQTNEQNRTGGMEVRNKLSVTRVEGGKESRGKKGKHLAKVHVQRIHGNGQQAGD